MERLRSACLWFAVAFVILHLSLLAVPAMALLASVERSGFGGTGPVFALVGGLGALGGLALALALRAFERRGRGMAVMLVAAGLAYAVIAGSGLRLMGADDAATGTLLGGLEVWMAYMPVVIGGFARSPMAAALVIVAYAGALILAGLLGLRARAVDGRDDRR